MIPLLSFLFGSVLYRLFAYFPLLCSLLAALALLALARKRMALAAALMAIGALYAPLREHVIGRVAGPQPGETTLNGHFISPPAKISAGYSQEFRVSADGDANGYANGFDSGPDYDIEVLSPRPFPIGLEQELWVNVKRPRQRLNPGERQREPYATLKAVMETGGEVHTPGVAANRIRARLNDFITENHGSTGEAALIMAVTTGFRGGVSPELREAFTASGLAHLLSISGTHFGMFAVMLFGVFRFALRRLPVRVLQTVTVYLTPSEGAALLTLPFALMYLGISGAAVPASRAFITVMLFLVGLLLGRRGHWLNFLLLAAFVLVIIDPEVLMSLSFQLSFTAVAFIGFIVKGGPGGTGPMEPVEPVESAEPGTAGGRAGPFLKKLFLMPLMVSLAATLGVAPLAAYYFNYFSLISPVSNFLVTPLVCFVLVPLSLCSSALFLIAGSDALVPAAGAVAGASVSLAKALSEVPLASVAVPAFPIALLIAFYLGFALFFAFRRRALLAVALLPPLVYLALCLGREAPFSITFLDVGNANASVVELRGGKVIVIDTGWSGREVEGHLRRRGIRKIEALVLTHGHRDHCGGAQRLIEKFEVGEVWDNGRLVYPEGLAGRLPPGRALRAGDRLRAGGFTATVLHPYEGFYSAWGRRNTGENNESLVLKLEAEGVSFLFPGDIEEEAIDDVLGLQGPEGAGGEGAGRNGAGPLQSDVIIVPHHGMRSSFSGRFLKEVSPSVAVVSHDEAPPALRAALGGGRVWLTAKEGAVKVTALDGGLKVKSYAGARLERARGLGEELGNLRRLFSAW